MVVVFVIMGRAGDAPEMRATGFEPWDPPREEFKLLVFLEFSLGSFFSDDDEIEILSSKLLKVELLFAAGRWENGFSGGVMLPELEVLIAFGFGARTWMVYGCWC